MIYALYIAVAVLGFIVTVILFSMLHMQYEEYKLKKHMKSEKGFAEILNYGIFYDHQTLVNKNGSITVMYEIHTTDSKTMTEGEMLRRNDYFNQAIMSLGEGWTIHLDVNRMRSVNAYPSIEDSKFTEAIAKAVDMEQRNKFDSEIESEGLFENKVILSMTFMPELVVAQKFSEMIFTKDEEEQKADKETLKMDRSRKLIESTNLKLKEFITQLSGGVTGIRRIGVYEYEGALYSEILEHLQFCISGTDNPVLFPMSGMTSIDNVVAEEYYSSLIPFVGDPQTGSYLQVVAIDGFPDLSFPDVLANIALMPMEYRWSTRYILLSRSQALSEVDSNRKRWKQKERGFVSQLLNVSNPSKINLDAVDMATDALEAVKDIESGRNSFGYYSSNVIVRGKSIKEVQEKSLFVAEKVRLLGFKARIESPNTNEAFLGSLPSHVVENVRRPLICSTNLTDFIPISQVYEGSRYNPSDKYPPFSPSLMTTVTHGRTPFNFNIHVTDKGHTFIVGGSGGGKSYLLGNMALFFNKYPNIQINVFDVGYSMMPLCHAMNGTHQALAIDSEGDNSVYIDPTTQFNPVKSLYNTQEGREWLVSEFFGVIFSCNNLDYPIKVQSALRQALNLMVENKKDGNLKNPDLSELVFTATLPEEHKMVLSSYLRSEPVGKFFDAENDSFSESNFRVWDMERLLTLNEKYVYPILMYLFFRIETSIKRDETGSPSLIILDEAWIMLKNDFFRSKLDDWLRTLRKYNCAVIMATQNILEMSKSGILPIILGSCDTKIFLPDSDIKGNEKIKEAYQSVVGLTDKDLDIISNAIPKMEYYTISDAGKGIFHLDSSYIGRAISSSSKAKNVKLTQLLKEGREDWLYHYLYYCITEELKGQGNLDFSWINDYLNKHGFYKEVN